MKQTYDVFIKCTNKIKLLGRVRTSRADVTRSALTGTRVAHVVLEGSVSLSALLPGPVWPRLLCSGGVVTLRTTRPISNLSRLTNQSQLGHCGVGSIRTRPTLTCRRYDNSLDNGLSGRYWVALVSHV